MENPTGGTCEVKKCCESRNIRFCGECEKFPCYMLVNMGKEYGYDSSIKINQCRKWLKENDMWYDNIFNEVEQIEDIQQGEKMSAYMKNNFLFRGIPMTDLKNMIKIYWKDEPKNQGIDWDFVHVCWEKDYREAQYIAIEYLKRKKKKFVENDIDELEYMITTKSWWETVDSIDAFVGIIALQCPKVKEKMLDWSKSDNMWIRRVAIDYQQEYKEQTDTEQLETIICNNFGTDEFYINKAIGWSLRDYSKINPQWVSDFIEKYRDKLAKLSIKEAGKYI